MVYLFDIHIVIPTDMAVTKAITLGTSQAEPVFYLLPFAWVDADFVFFSSVFSTFAFTDDLSADRDTDSFLADLGLSSSSSFFASLISLTLGFLGFLSSS